MSRATILYRVRDVALSLAVGALAVGLAGCGDNCERLCSSVRDRIEQCKPASLTWNDLGAKGPQNFVNECRDQWDRERLSLSAPELRRALAACNDTRDQLDARRGDEVCDDILALYGVSE